MPIPMDQIANIPAFHLTIPISGFDLCCFSARYGEGQRGALLAARFALEAVYARLR